VAHHYIPAHKLFPITHTTERERGCVLGILFTNVLMCCACILHRKYLYRVDRERRPRTNAAPFSLIIITSASILLKITTSAHHVRARKVYPAQLACMAHSYFVAEINKYCWCAQARRMCLVLHTQFSFYLTAIT
jgi:hypothetical protein